jgi:hypothetical protein
MSSVCFGFCTGQGNDPSLLEASVASTGFGDVAAYPNTYAGYVQALAHLRDLYAPNVLIGLDVSQFATGDDIGLDTNPSSNMATLGQQVGAFMNKAGPHDLLFNNPLDRDAGQYKALFGQNRWWDRLNVALPNFVRWEQYLKAISAADSGRSIVLWQVPVGNQYFDTENNTNNHFQDNRPEYIFGHIAELIQSGIVGAIFSAGNAGNTTYTDASGDGVTNPASFCTTDGISSEQMCNNHMSTVADDDGGFIRMSAQAYYQNPISLSAGGSATAPPTPIPTTTLASMFTTSVSTAPTASAPGATVTVATAVNSSQAATVLVDVEVYDPSSNKVFQQAFDSESFTAGQNRTFPSSWQVSATAAAGTYTVKVGIFSPGWGTLFAWNNSAGIESIGTSAPATSTLTLAATSTPTLAPTSTNTPTATPSPTPTSTSTATSTATFTPTRTPPPTNTPLPPTSTAMPPARSFTTGANVVPPVLSRGATDVITVSTTSATSATALVDVEMYDSTWKKVFQQFWDNQTFSAGQPRTFTATWTPPSTLVPGTYTVMVGIFSTGWGTLYNWNSNATTLTLN